jgi:phosphoesterase RecJ-like protein
MTLNDCAAFLEAHDRYLILSHRRPDGDAAGSASALCLGLRKLGKTAFALPNPEATPRQEAMLSPCAPPADFRPETVVSVDLAEEGILQLNGEAWAGKIDLCIDHHPSNSHYAGQVLLDPAAGACGELIYLLFRRLQVPVDPELATLLYIAVTTDTGCFRYKNTCPQTLRVGADLLEAGAPVDLNRTLFMKKSRPRLLLESRMISGLRYFQNEEASLATVTLADLAECGAAEADLEDIASVAGSVEGVELSITLREVGDGEWKVSLRTGQYGNASSICAEFGGGGHGMAAGCTVRGSREEVTAKLMEAVALHWHEAPL